MGLHNEIEFENDICHHLGAHGWLYAAPGSDGDARTLISAAVTGQLDFQGLALE